MRFAPSTLASALALSAAASASTAASSSPSTTSPRAAAAAAFAPPPASTKRFGASRASPPPPPPPSSPRRGERSTTTESIVALRRRRAAGRRRPPLALSSAAAAAADAGDASEGEGSTSAAGGGAASVSSHVFNLVKGIVGAGVLSLPAGIAAFGNAPTAVVPAIILVAAIGGFSAYGFSLIGRVCSYVGATSYRDAWDKSVGTSTSVIPAASCTFKTITACVAYSMILADTFKALLMTAGKSVTRSNTLLGITGLVLLPLCLMKNLSSLAPFSLLGSVGMAYVAIAMAIRYFGGSYLFPAGQFLPDLPVDLQPSFGSIGAEGVFHPSSFILICMLSTAYMAHFNAPKFYAELKNNTIKRFNKVVTTSFGISVAIFSAIASLGFLTFGQNSSGFILNNYSNGDPIMSFGRVAVAASLIFSYPLAFVGAREGVLDLLNVPRDDRKPDLLNKITVVLLGSVTALALKLKDVSFVLSFAGATLGNALIYVYPALMFRGAVKKMKEKTKRGDRSKEDIDRLSKETKFAMGVAGLGCAFGAVGASMALKTLG